MAETVEETDGVQSCPRCGKPLRARTAEGLCPRCLLAAALARPRAWDHANVEDPSPLPASAGGGEVKNGIRRIGDYEIEEELARGGMGVVYRARQLTLNRTVALKLILAGELASEEAVARFHTEARAAARLDHPNIVSVYESGEREGQCFLAMKLVEGENLGEAGARERLWSGVGFKTGGAGDAYERSVRIRPVRLVHVATVMVSIARAVHYAHQRGVLHRDIKPANLLRDGEGRVYLTDFGLARWVEEDSRLTHTRAVLGTPAYISPEQAEGKARAVTTSTDVYGLGAALYELMTGEAPFAGGTTYETIRQVMEREPKRPSLWKSDIDRDLEILCLKCLEKDPSQRYGSAEALADDLERWLKGEPLLARPVSHVEQLKKWIRREPVRAWSAALILLALITVALVSTVLGLRVEAARKDLKKQVESNQRQLVRMNVGAGMERVERGDELAALPYFAEALRLQSVTSEALREKEHRIRFGMARSLAPQLEQIWFTPLDPLDLVFDETGTWLAASVSKGVRLYRTAGDFGWVKTLKHTEEIQFVVVNGKSKRVVALTGDHRAHLWDLEEGVELMEPVAGVALTRPVFSPDGERFVIGFLDGARLFDAARGLALGQFMSHAGMVTSLAYSSNGAAVLTTSLDKTARVWSGLTGEPLTPPLEHSHAVVRGAFGRSSDVVATVGQLDDVWVHRVPSGERVGMPYKPGPVVVDLRQRRDGTWWILGVGGGGARVWDGGARLPVSPWMKHSGGVNGALFSTDGDWLISTSWDDTTRLWHSLSGTPVSSWVRHSGFVVRQALSPKSDQWATAGVDRSVRLWRLPRRGGASVRLSVRGNPQSVSWNAASDRLDLWNANGIGMIYQPQGGGVENFRMSIQAPLSWVRRAVPAHVAADGRDWLVAGSGQTVLLRRAFSTNEPAVFEHRGLVRDAAVSRDGAWVGTMTDDRVVQMWNVQTHQVVWTDRSNPNLGVRAIMDPAGRNMWVSYADRTVQGFEVATGRKRGGPLIHDSIVMDADISPDGRWLAAAVSDTSLEGRAVWVWDISDQAVDEAGRSPRYRLPHRDGVLRVIFSADGRRLLTGSEDYFARIWDLSTGKAVTSPLRHSERVEMLAFDRGGFWVATGSSDGRVRVWNAESGEPVTPWLQHGSKVTDLSFDETGTRLVVSSGDGIRIWSLQPMAGSVDELREWAELLSARRLSGTGDLEPVEPSQFKTIWEHLKPAGGDRTQ